MKTTFYITKGSKKVDSFYLNELPINFIHETKKKKNELNFEVDNLGFFKRLAPQKMFPIRSNSNIFFKSVIEAKNYIDNAKKTILNDDRFCDRIKNELLNYTKTFKIIS
jgi:hypothetical protein